MTTPAAFSFRPIGVVESPYKEKFGTPRQPGLVAETLGSILLRDDLNPDSLEGLCDYSHVWVLFVFHENQAVKEGRETVKTKVHPPRLEGKAVGVFATRSPHRPNPIGLSLVEIEKIEGRRVFIRGLDLIDGTPVLDLKPYLPSIEAPPNAKEGWSGPLASKSVTIEWSEQARKDAATAFGGIGHGGSSHDMNLRMAAIEKNLELDPRPVSYRGTPENPDPYTSIYGFRFEDWNVVFRMLATDSKTDGETRKRAVIERIESWENRSNSKPK